MPITALKPVGLVIDYLGGPSVPEGAMPITALKRAALAAPAGGRPARVPEGAMPITALKPPRPPARLAIAPTRPRGGHADHGIETYLSTSGARTLFRPRGGHADHGIETLI